VLGELPAVARKAAVLREHCARTGRAVELSHLTTALVGRDPAEVARLVEARRPRAVDAGRYAEQVHAGTVTDQVGRFRELAEVGVAEVAVRLPDLRDAAPVARMAEVIAAFRLRRA
jgi:predicted aconitase